MKHPEEMDLHDADQMRIEELEAQLLAAQFDIETRNDRIAELENQLRDCEEELSGCNSAMYEEL